MGTPKLAKPRVQARSSGAQAGRIPSSCSSPPESKTGDTSPSSRRRGLYQSQVPMCAPRPGAEVTFGGSQQHSCWTEDAAPDKRRRPSKPNQRNGLNPPGEEGGTPPLIEVSTTRPRYPTGQGSPDTTS